MLRVGKTRAASLVALLVVTAGVGLPGSVKAAGAELITNEIVNTPPDCSSVAASPSVLQRPSRQLHTVTLTGATDPEGPVTIAVTGVTQDEPVGDAPDAASGGSADQVQVRAERDGRGDGRVYRITFTATDADGGTCSGSVIVSVPHHEGAPTVDSGNSYDSFGQV